MDTNRAEELLEVFNRHPWVAEFSDLFRCHCTSPLDLQRLAQTIMAGVLDQDHIKIRHDASIALTIRTMLDVWKYAVDGDGAINQAQPRKVRPLRGARLVLVNDRSEGLMVL